MAQRQHVASTVTARLHNLKRRFRLLLLALGPGQQHTHFLRPLRGLPRCLSTTGRLMQSSVCLSVFVCVSTMPVHSWVQGTCRCRKRSLRLGRSGAAPPATGAMTVWRYFSRMPCGRVDPKEIMRQFSIALRSWTPVAQTVLVQILSKTLLWWDKEGKKRRLSQSKRGRK